MDVLTIANTKGGSGKSTIAINIAVAASLAGLRVLLVDTDPQGTTREWGKSRTRDGGPSVVDCSSNQLAAVLESAEKDGYELVIVDVAGHDDVGLVGVFRLSTFVLVPSAPFAEELRVTRTARRIVDAARKKSRICLVKTTGPQVGRTLSTIESYPDHFATVSLRSLVAYADSYARSEGVMETFPTSVAAIEVQALLTYVLKAIKECEND